MLSFSDNSGQTLPELLIATVIGLIVVFAAFLALETSLTQNNRISQREDATQRGRLALEQITRELRSQLCVTGLQPAITAGSDSSISITTDLDGDIPPTPMLRQITYTPPPTSQPNGPGTITEYDYQGTAPVPNTTFPTTPTSHRVLLQNVVPIAGVPIFQYFPFATSGTPGVSTTPLQTPLNLQREGLAVDIRVSFVARGTASPNGNPNVYGSTFQDDVYTRIADPTSPALGTNCS